MVTIDRYNTIGFVGGFLAGLGIPVLTMVIGGGLVILEDQKKYKEAGWGVIFGAGSALALELLAAVVNRPPQTAASTAAANALAKVK